MIKSISIVVGYLFVLSSAYYLIYFGSINIDVFQYLSVDDMIKGIAYPLRNASGFFLYLLFALLAALAIGNPRQANDSHVAEQGVDSLRVRTGIIGALIFSLVLVVVCLCVLGSGIVPYAEYVALIAAVSASIVSMTVYWLVTYQDLSATTATSTDNTRTANNNSDKDRAENRLEPVSNKDGNAQKLLDYIIISTLSYFLISTISFGMLNTTKLTKCLEYDYIIGIKGTNMDSLGLNSCRLIYLGSVSDKYLFSDSTSIGKRHVILSKDKLPVFSVIHYSAAKHTELIWDYGVILATIVMVLIIGICTVWAYSGIVSYTSEHSIMLRSPIRIRRVGKLPRNKR